MAMPQFSRLAQIAAVGILAGAALVGSLSVQDSSAPIGDPVVASARADSLTRSDTSAFLDMERSALERSQDAAFERVDRLEASGSLSADKAEDQRDLLRSVSSQFNQKLDSLEKSVSDYHDLKPDSRDFDPADGPSAQNHADFLKVVGMMLGADGRSTFPNHFAKDFSSFADAALEKAGVSAEAPPPAPKFSAFRSQRSPETAPSISPLNPRL